MGRIKDKWRMGDLLVHYVTEELKTGQDLTLRNTSLDNSRDDCDPNIGSGDIVRRGNSGDVDV